MTTEEVNALPEPVRRYIHDLETRCDPAGEVAALALTQDQNRHLQAEVLRLREQIKIALAVNYEKPRLVTIHITATETGVSATYPADANCRDVVNGIWQYVRRANKRGEIIRGPIRGLYPVKEQTP